MGRFEKKVTGPDDDHMGFGDKLNRLTKSRRYSVARLATECGMSQQTLSRWINEGIPEQVTAFLSLARTLNVPAEWLADDLRSWPPPSPKLKLVSVSDSTRRELAAWRSQLFDGASREDSEA